MSEVKMASTSVVPELRACDFKQLIQEKQKAHFAGTREWVFDEIRKFLREQERFLWLAGAAGTGKSVVSAMLFETEGVREHIVAWHFCRHDNAAESSVRVMIESWAAMMSAKVSGFVISEEVRLKALGASSSLEMFELLIAGPVKQMAKPPSGPLLIVLDALDELPRQSVDPVLDLIINVFAGAMLPPFVKLFITSRREEHIKTRLKGLKPMEFQVDEIRNRADVKAYLVHIARNHFKMEVTWADLEGKLEREFELKDGTLHNKLSRLEKPFRDSKDIYDNVLRPIKESSSFQSVCEVSDKYNPDLKQNENVLGKLYEDAQEAREKKLHLFATEWEEFNRIESKQGAATILRQPKKGTAVEWIDNAIDPGLKSEDSATRKIKDSYGGNACLMKDLVRFTLECDNCERLAAVLRRLQQEPGLKVMMLKNKFANPSLLGYCDMNVSIQVELANKRSHICEVQVNLKEMVKAKERAHVYYEEIRELIPQICDEAGIETKAQRERFERRVMQMLRRSALDVAVEQLEAKAGGLFLYATLLARELESQPGLRDLSKLRELPNGLSEIYEGNFNRMVKGGKVEWSKYKRVVSMITVAREPPPQAIAQQVLGSEEFAEISRSLSMLFPIIDGRFHVMHKSVVDWLQQPNGLYSLSSEDCDRAHQELATVLLALVHEFCGVSHANYEGIPLEITFALRQVTYHLCETGLLEKAHVLAKSFDWLLARAAIGDPALLLADVERVNERQDNPLTKLLASALRLALGALRDDWRCLAGQLVGRLLSHVAVDEVHDLLQQVCRWQGPAEGWWCPMQPTLEPAGGSNILTCLHSAEVSCAQWSPDGKFICSGGKDKKVRVWEVSSGECVRTMIGHSGWVDSVSWSPDGTRICSGGTDKTVRVWEVSSGECVQTMTGLSYCVLSMSWSPDSSKICGGCHDKKIRVWEVASGECVRTMTGHSYGVNSVSWSPDSSRICSGSDDSTVRVWEVASGECVRTMSGHSREVCSVSWSPDNSKICSGSNDKTVRVWEVASGECVRTMTGHSYGMYSVSWSPDGTRICGGSYQTMRVWEVASGECVQTMTGLSHAVVSVSWSPNSSRICSGSTDFTVRVWEVSSGESTGTSTGQQVNSHHSQVNSVSWSPDGSRICSGSNDKTVRVWEVSSGECVRTMTDPADWVDSVSWSPDGTKICGGSRDKTVRVWEVASGESVRTMAGHFGFVYSVSWSPDNSKICGGISDGTVRVWEVASGECVQTLKGHIHTVVSVSWSPDGSTIRSRDIVETRVWEVASGRCLETASSPHVNLATFSRDECFRSTSDGVGPMSPTYYLLFSPDSTRAFAQMGEDRASIHTLHRLGGSTVDDRALELLARHREAALRKQAEKREAAQIEKAKELKHCATEQEALGTMEGGHTTSSH